MRNNAIAMNTCAAGAMLFGGTLGVAQDAHAGLTWTSVSATAYNYGGGMVGQDTSTAGTPVFTSGSDFIGFSAATANGWSISASNLGGASLAAIVYNEFTISSATSVILSGIGFGNPNSNFFSLTNVVTSETAWTSETFIGSGIEVTGAYNSGPITLQAGTYSLTGSIYPVGSFGSSTLLEIAVVPAPGAFALLGAAGLISSRRRKA
jgi:hypothetical protein